MSINNKNFLIVFAHPNPKSYNSAILKHTIKYIKSNNQDHNVEVSNLYEMNFKSFACAEDFKNPLNSLELDLIKEQINAMEKNEFSDEIKTEMEKVLRADNLIFIFPLWWGGAPSILKGWFDKIFACNFAWGFENMYEKGLLKGKRAIIFTTIGGDKHEYSAEGDVHADITQVLHPYHRCILAFCGIEVLPIHEIYEVEVTTDEIRKKYLEDIEGIVKNFNSTYDLIQKF
jgi:NAD(P)H dehydrogenase (quinone)